MNFSRIHFYFIFLGVLPTLFISASQESDWAEQGVVKAARKRMSPELEACPDFECVENLLYQDEERALDSYLGSMLAAERKELDAAWCD